MYLLHAQHIHSLRKQMPNAPMSGPEVLLADEVKASGTVSSCVERKGS
jgi:hypothetical protein